LKDFYEDQTVEEPRLKADNSLDNLIISKSYLNKEEVDSDDLELNHIMLKKNKTNHD